MSRGGQIIVIVVLLAAVAGVAVYILRAQPDYIDEYNQAGRDPKIRPDYRDIVIPPNIAALNFLIEEQGTGYCVKIHSKQAPAIEVFSKTPKIIIPQNRWRQLLSNNKGQIYKIDNEIFLGHPGYRVLPEIPENLIAKPTLTWLYDNKKRGPHQLEVSYLTKNINLKADYVLLLNKDDTSSDISGWVTLDNRSGAMYRDAQLKLVAGEVHRVEERFQDKAYAMMGEKMARAPQFKEKAFFEYHIYDLQRRTTIKDKQTKQINLLEATGVRIDKELLVYGIRSYFTRQYRGKNPKQPVNVFIKFKNSKENNLGMPLPAGIMRLYKEDDDGSQQFIGEDRIEHTPKDEEVKLKIGEAFDVVAERFQTDYRRISTRLHESEWEITLRNHKDEEIKVGVVEPVFGNWRVISNTHPYRKVDAFTIRFDVKIPKDEEVKIKYRVKVGL